MAQITQADREALVEIMEIGGEAACRILSGETDKFERVLPKLEALARHRTQKEISDD